LQKDIIEKERDRSEKLLLNILPVRVANDLKEKGRTEPQIFCDVTVFFSDIVGFTRQSSKFAPQHLIDELNELFTAFDLIIEENKCERIKTIGDAYLAVCGMPAPDPDHASRMMNASIGIINYLEERNKKSEVKWQVRIGLHSGEVVGGVVGIKKYIYDVFGDTINTASRMESNSEPMQINVSEATYNILKDKYRFLEREPYEVKGKGKMKMFFLEGAY
jgi:class 3 adenylate cyclase